MYNLLFFAQMAGFTCYSGPGAKIHSPISSVHYVCIYSVLHTADYTQRTIHRCFNYLPTNPENDPMSYVGKPPGPKFSLV